MPKPLSPFKSFPLHLSIYLLPTLSKQRRVQFITCKHPQYRPHRARMHHLLPTPSLLRLCRRRRPLPNHLLLLLRPNPNNSHLPRHRHQCSRLHLLSHPGHDFPPPNIRLRRYRYRRPTPATVSIGVMEKVYGYPRPETSRWTTPSPHPPTIPLPTLRFHQTLVSDRQAW